jgi:hypothetical protein
MSKQKIVMKQKKQTKKKKLALATGNCSSQGGTRTLKRTCGGLLRRTGGSVW